MMWEEANQQAMFAAYGFKSASDVVWRQTTKSEAAVQLGKCSASLLWDMYKFYETMDLEDLATRCDELDFPQVVSRLCIAAYRAPRYLKHQRFHPGAVPGDSWCHCGMQYCY